LRQREGEFKVSRKARTGQGFDIEEILEGDILSEVKLDTAQSINETYRRFGEKFGLKVEETPLSQVKPTKGASPDLQSPL